KNQADLRTHVRQVNIRLALALVPGPQRVANNGAVLGNLLPDLLFELLAHGLGEGVLGLVYQFLEPGPRRRAFLDPLRNLERRLDRRTRLVEEKLREVAGRSALRCAYADDLHRPGRGSAADAVFQDARRLQGRRQGDDLIAA